MNGKLANEQISKLANVHPDNYREGRIRIYLGVMLSPFGGGCVRL
jgi:hypothetical protein